MSYRFIDVKRYKRGAKWPDGKPRYCTRCGAENRRRKQATVTALMQYLGAKTKVPVGYCDEHTPEGINK
jgi:hypothetical protein